MPPLRDPERTYVSTIYENSNYHASWAPSRPVRVGDYGHLQSDYSFAVEGNIFDDSLAAMFGIAYYSAPTEEIKCVVSRHVNQVTQSATGNIGLPWLCGAKLAQTFRMSSSHGAILTMASARYVSLEPSGTLKDVIYSTAFNKNQLLVSEAYTCPSYARLLVLQQQRDFQITLETEALGFQRNSGHPVKWTHSADGGDFMSGVSEDGAPAFTPLFRLVGREKAYRKLPIRELSPPKWRRVVHINRTGRPQGAISNYQIVESENEYETSRVTDC